MACQAACVIRTGRYACFLYLRDILLMRDLACLVILDEYDMRRVV